MGCRSRVRMTRAGAPRRRLPSPCRPSAQSAQNARRSPQPSGGSVTKMSAPGGEGAMHKDPNLTVLLHLRYLRPRRLLALSDAPPPPPLGHDVRCSNKQQHPDPLPDSLSPIQTRFVLFDEAATVLQQYKTVSDSKCTLRRYHSFRIHPETRKLWYLLRVHLESETVLYCCRTVAASWGGSCMMG